MQLHSNLNSRVKCNTSSGELNSHLIAGFLIMETKWHPIIGYESLYEINEVGEIKSLPKQHGRQYYSHGILKTKINIGGYCEVRLSNNKIDKHITVHRLVATQFIPNDLNKPCINHINGIKTDNRVENLEWVDYFENMKHAVDTGLLSVKGEKNPACKIKDENVIDIFTSPLTAKELSLKYNISEALIGKIRAQTIWKSVTFNFKKYDRRLRQNRTKNKN